MKTFYSLLGCLLMGLALVGCQSTALTSAKVYLQQNDSEHAEEQLKLAVAQHPEDVEAHYWLGTVYARTGRYQEMNASFDRALALSTKYQKDIAQERQKYWVEQHKRGVKAFEADDIAGAAEAFQGATTIDPGRVEAFKNLALCYYRLEDTDRVIFAYERALDLAPRDPDVLRHIGLLLLDQKNYERAARYLEQASEADPTNIRILWGLASAYEQMNRLDDAVMQCRKAIDLEPANADLRHDFALVLYKKEDYTGAAQAYEEALKINPDDKDVRFNLAIVYLWRLDDPDSALPHLQHIVERDPENAEAWETLSSAYAKKDMLKEAKEAEARSKALKAE